MLSQRLLSSAPPWWCQGLSTDNSRERTLFPCCDTCHWCPSCLASLRQHGLEAAEWAAPSGALYTQAMAGRGLLGCLPGSVERETQKQSHSLGRCWLELRRGKAGSWRALCPRWFLPRAHRLPPSLCTLNKKGEQALPSASLIRESRWLAAQPHVPHTRPLLAGEEIGASWAGAKSSLCSLHRHPQPTPTAVCSLFPREAPASSTTGTRNAGWVQPDAVSRRRLLSVSLLLNQTQRTLPDSARARSGITHHQACSGQRHAWATTGEGEVPVGASCTRRLPMKTLL